ncbi:unnamed protein product [Acanthoscelides obtectus]|uniref:Uncharacterized protein n=1 Tax=Acanthoscelides obtectus TaxID=200917 RepID=A0A9P0PMT4_ACAOB|nr:unnamed protein product [Acanthoscelides obtectus]CAK1626890.1 Ecdysone receptor [Acanthoscelides obtectus]
MDAASAAAIKHEMIYREDDVQLLVKSEPSLIGYGGGNGLLSVSAASSVAGACGGNNAFASSVANFVGTTVTVATVATAGGQAMPQFEHMPPAAKRPRTSGGADDFLGSPSPGAMSVGGGAPLTPSPGPPSSQPYASISNGYSSPMSSGSYDPYSPNGKIGESTFSSNFYLFFSRE